MVLYAHDCKCDTTSLTSVQREKVIKTDNTKVESTLMHLICFQGFFYECDLNTLGKRIHVIENTIFKCLHIVFCALAHELNMITKCFGKSHRDLSTEETKARKIEKKYV